LRAGRFADFPPSQCFVGYPNVPISPLLRFFFLGEVAFYAHSTFAHFTIEVRRGDFMQMAIHHIATTILVGGAYFSNYQRIGGILLIMHDLGDVTLETGKVLLYAGWEKIATVMLAFLNIFWWWFRVIFWGYKVFLTSFVHSISVMGRGMAYYYLFNLLLVIIWALNAFWGFLITRIAIRKVMEGELEDSREADKDSKKKK
jgi:TLC domain